MFLLKEVNRQSATEASCVISRDGADQRISVLFIEHLSEMRGIEFPDLSPAAIHELANCDEFQALVTALWQCQHGYPMDIPTEIIAF